MLSDWNELSDEARKEIDPQYWQKLPDRTEEEKSKSNRLINVYVSMARAIRENLPGVNFRRLPASNSERATTQHGKPCLHSGKNAARVGCGTSGTRFHAR